MLNSSCTTAKQLSIKDLASCQENYTVKSDLLQSKIKQLEDVIKQLETVNKQLAVFTNYLQLLESVYNQIEQMETCRVKLKEYCELKGKGESVTKFEKNTMKRFENHIGCKERISKNHYGRVFPSYTLKLDILLEIQEMLVDLLLTGNLKEMENVLEQEKSLPFNKCQFMCELEEQEEETTKTNYFEKAKNTTWSVLQRVFKQNLSSAIHSFI